MTWRSSCHLYCQRLAFSHRHNNSFIQPLNRRSTALRFSRSSFTAASFSTTSSSLPLSPFRLLSTSRFLDPTAESAVNNLLYNVQQHRQPPSRHTLCALVSNESGVLSRVAGCLAGRGFNIDSLVVSETETAGLSRMTIVLNGTDEVLEQAKKQLEDLVQVWAVVEFSPFAAVVERELLLVKLNILPHLNPSPNDAKTAVSGTATSSKEIPSIRNETDSQRPSHDFYTRGYPVVAHEALQSHIQRQAIVELCNLFQGRVLDLTPSFIMIELTGKSVKIDAFIELVKPFGIRELARSGALAMLRGQVTSVTSRDKQHKQQQQQVDESQLPPG